MLPNGLILGWCLGVLVVSTAGAAARPSAIGPAEFLPAELPSFESLAVSTSSSIPLVPPATRIAQNASDRNNAVANIPNTANVSLQMSPGQSVAVGAKISFRVTTRKPGYLLLVDIDANGKMSQIFPSPEMIVQSQEVATNFIKPGEELLIPNSAAKKRGFEYVITPPTGQAAVVAILSDRRVQILDLPDNTQKPRTEAETISYLTGWTSELRVPDPGSGKLQPSNWSFDIKQYSIR
jgi:Domain of unknown function (DUF4384)